MRINVALLPKHVQDLIELRESVDQTFYRFVDENYSDWFWDMLNQKRGAGSEKSILISMTGPQGSGKSLSAISICSFLDSSFNVEQIFFNYNRLVYARSELKDNCAVLVDEQSQTYGLDAHRVMIILANMKEQLRKRGIHFIFCSPVLYEEAKSSMFQIETMFIDEEEQECICALKTREGLTLGHIRIPHPLKPIDEKGGLASKELVDAYEKKKDEHLDKVLGRGDYDIFEERAREVIRNNIFIKAEKIYVKRYGFIPSNSLIQLINKLYPEFNAGVVSAEIAGRVRLDKELSGKWDIAGRSTRRRDGT